MSKLTDDQPSNIIDLSKRRRARDPSLAQKQSLPLVVENNTAPHLPAMAVALLRGRRAGIHAGGEGRDRIDAATIIRDAIRYGSRYGRPPSRMPSFVREHLEAYCREGNLACLTTRDWLNGNQALLERLVQPKHGQADEERTDDKNSSGEGRA